MISKKNINEIKKLGLKIDHDSSFSGKSKGNKHLSRVVQIAKYLSKELGADERVVEAGAWLHDTALPSGNDYDYKKNKKIVLKLLLEFSLSEKDRNLIAECVASHEGTEIPKTLEAKIVHDSDVLEKLGILGIIRQTWKMTNSNKINHKNITENNIKEIVNHLNWRKKRLQTPLARKIANNLDLPIKKEDLKIIVPLIARMAFEGIITEKIAIRLEKHLSKNENAMLKKQLTLSYLS